jgi:prevent-host-death family protein
MVSVNIYEAKSQLSRLVASVETGGGRVVLCRNGTPVADIVPHQKTYGKTLQPDPDLLGARFLEDPAAPLCEADWPEVLR